MSKDTATLNSLWAYLIVEELVRNGVDTFVISPGSRSTPLTVAAARNPRAKTVTHFDERGAAYFALGAAKATGLPCALICTSGTAVANYFPAIVEASQSCVPLIVLTADRPPELQGTGANQTINQANIYGSFARAFVQLPCPDDGVRPETTLVKMDEAVDTAFRAPMGPVHVNCPYREPLAPCEISVPNSLMPWHAARTRYTPKEPRTSNFADIEWLREALRKTDRVLVVQGNCSDAVTCDLDNIAAWPVIADIGSNTRRTNIGARIVANFDQLLLSKRFREMARPELVLHFGGPLVSKRTTEFLAECRPAHYVHFSVNGRPVDPYHCVTHRVTCSEVNVLDVAAPPQSDWTNEILGASAACDQAITSLLAKRTDLTEPGVIRAVSRELSNMPDPSLFLGNSMPVRDADMFSGVLDWHVGIVTNRGASGIDGNIATAAGFSKASGDHVTAVIGDVAALHDLNSLALLKQEGVFVTLVIINNDGGGIFHFLPIASHGDVFEQHFSTPHGMQFDDAAHMFNLPYARPDTMDEFLRILRAARATGQSQIIEVRTDREENLRLHREIGDAVVKALEDR